MYVIYDTLTTNRWRIASITSECDLLAGVVQARSLLLLGGTVLMLLGAFCAIIFARQLVAPLQLLATKVREVGSQRVTFDVNTHDEIGVLNDGLFHMMQRIDELNQQVRTELDQKRIAEIASLQAQINPHFLYNTLYDVQQLCELNDTQTATEMVAMLARFYQIGVSRGSEIIPLRDQLTQVISYLDIQQLRYQDIFDYQIDISEELLDAPTIKLTLQPLVENAIYHGVKLRAEAGGQIRIRAWYKDNDLYVEVADNGPGVSPNKLLKLREELTLGVGMSGIHGYGLRNVHTRLRLHYGEPYGLLLESKEGTSFIAYMHIPIELGKAYEQNDFY